MTLAVQEPNPLSPWLLVPAAYVLVSGATFAAYGWDKWCAAKSRSRVPESTLHVLEAFGGWPGALVAMRMFRHKTLKWSFKLVTFSIALAHVVGWAWFAFERSRTS